MNNDPRDIIWNETYGLYYDTYFNELLTLRLIDKWSYIDRLIKILIVTSALLSTLIGLFFWSSTAFFIFWFILSSIVLILSIVYFFINVTDKIKQLMKENKEFMSLRYVMETLRSDLDLNPDFDIKQHRNQLTAYKSTYDDICRNNPNDILADEDLKGRTQRELNKRLSNIIKKGKLKKASPGKTRGYVSKRVAPNPKPEPVSRQFKYTGRARV